MVPTKTRTNHPLISTKTRGNKTSAKAVSSSLSRSNLNHEITMKEANIRIRGTQLTVNIDEESRANFFDRVDVRGEHDCWPWIGYIASTGYGSLGFEGTKITSHRLSYAINIGPIPAGLYVCHSCDNPRCVNPSHLWLGTNKTNIEDALKKGRLATGDRSTARRFPEKLQRGDNHWKRRRKLQSENPKPETVTL